MNNFAESLAYERRCQTDVRNDYEALGFEKIKRCSFHTIGGKEDQKADIDFKAYRNGKFLKVSEKFRSSDWGDFMFELVRDVAKKKESCLIKSRADILLYITPKYIYEFDAQDLKQLIEEILQEIENYNGINRSKGEFILKENQWIDVFNREAIEFPGFVVRSFPTTLMGELMWRNLVVVLDPEELIDRGINFKTYERICN